MGGTKNNVRTKEKPWHQAQQKTEHYARGSERKKSHGRAGGSPVTCDKTRTKSRKKKTNKKDRKTYRMKKKFSIVFIILERRWAWRRIEKRNLLLSLPSRRYSAISLACASSSPSAFSSFPSLFCSLFHASYAFPQSVVPVRYST